MHIYVDIRVTDTKAKGNSFSRKLFIINATSIWWLSVFVSRSPAFDFINKTKYQGRPAIS